MVKFLNPGIEEKILEIIKNGNSKEKKILNTLLATNKPTYETTISVLVLYNQYFGIHEYEEVFDGRFIAGYENIKGNKKLVGGFSKTEGFRGFNNIGNCKGIACWFIRSLSIIALIIVIYLTIYASCMKSFYDLFCIL